MAIAESTNEFNLPRSKEELDNYYKKIYKFTNEERKILADCYDDAFTYRALPLAVGLGVLADSAIRNGLIKPHRRFGSWPSTLLGMVCGSFLGMFSAYNTCYDKLRQTPNSMYGRYLQDKKYGNYVFEYTPKRMRSYLESVSDIESDVFSKPNALNLDMERPDVKHFDEIRRFPNDDAVENITHADQPKPLITYAQLRKQNQEAQAETTGYNYGRTTTDKNM